MGLIGREIEARGIPTLCLTSALSITRAVNPPRAVFLDFPLGHTAGKPNDPEGQRAIVGDALAAFETLQHPGEILELPYRWADDDGWKDAVMRPQPGGGHRDDRAERAAEPQYQTPADRDAAERALAAGGSPGFVRTE